MSLAPLRDLLTAARSARVLQNFEQLVAVLEVVPQQLTTLMAVAIGRMVADQQTRPYMNNNLNLSFYV